MTESSTYLAAENQQDFFTQLLTNQRRLDWSSLWRVQGQIGMISDTFTVSRAAILIWKLKSKHSSIKSDIWTPIPLTGT